jgi:peroxiredoxin
MLQSGNQVPHFEVRDLDGQVINYATVWQHRNLVLIVLPSLENHATGRYVDVLANVATAFGEHTTCVITRDVVAGVPAAAALVADQWGEIVYVRCASEITALPSPQELLDWISYLEKRCPECEGEAQ